VRALLDLMRENGAAVRDNVVHSEYLLLQATSCLKILDSEVGEQELVKSVAAELAKLTA